MWGELVEALLRRPLGLILQGLSLLKPMFRSPDLSTSHSMIQLLSEMTDRHGTHVPFSASSLNFGNRSGLIKSKSRCCRAPSTARHVVSLWQINRFTTTRN